MPAPGPAYSRALLPALCPCAIPLAWVPPPTAPQPPGLLTCPTPGSTSHPRPGHTDPGCCGLSILELRDAKGYQHQHFLHFKSFYIRSNNGIIDCPLFKCIPSGDMFSASSFPADVLCDVSQSISPGEVDSFLVILDVLMQQVPQCRFI